MLGNPYAQATEQYRKVEVGTVNKHELLVMLFDGAVRFLHEAQEAMRNRDIVTKALKIDRVLAIIGELRGSLNQKEGGDFAARMEAMYAYMSGRVLEASLTLDPAVCDEVISLIMPIREAWAELARRPDLEIAPESLPTFPPLPAYGLEGQRAPLEIFG